MSLALIRVIADRHLSPIRYRSKLITYIIIRMIRVHDIQYRLNILQCRIDCPESLQMYLMTTDLITIIHVHDIKITTDNRPAVNNRLRRGSIDRMIGVGRLNDLIVESLYIQISVQRLLSPDLHRTLSGIITSLSGIYKSIHIIRLLAFDTSEIRWQRGILSTNMDIIVCRTQYMMIIRPNMI